MRISSLLLLSVLLPAAVLRAAAPTTSTAPTTAPTSAPAVGNVDLAAYGTDERFWLVHQEPLPDGSKSPPPRMVFYSRSAGESAFSECGFSEDKFRGLASRGTQLAILEERAWVMVSESGTMTQGPDLPHGQRVVAIAGGQDTFWALGSADAAPTTSTAPTTATAPISLPATGPTSAPATTQAVAPPALYRLDNGVWKMLAPVPPRSVAAEQTPSLAIIAGTPYLAFMDGGAMTVLRFDGAAWHDFASIHYDQAASSATLLSGMPIPAVWIARDTGAGEILFLHPSAAPQKATLSFLPASAQSVAVAYALGRIRVVYVDKNVVMEQALSSDDGSLAGPAGPVTFPQNLSAVGINTFVRYVVWIALFIAIAGAMRWRRLMAGMVFDLEKIHLAPVIRRAAAGLIDLFPIIVAAAFLRFSRPAMQYDELLGGLSVGLYLLHTTFSEILTTRTLGKWLLGLRVVSLIGERPSAGSLLLRNLLRIIDVGLAFLPLLVIPISPLRQRTGDVAAGTLVVLADQTD